MCFWRKISKSQFGSFQQNTDKVTSRYIYANGCFYRPHAQKNSDGKKQLLATDANPTSRNAGIGRRLILEFLFQLEEYGDGIVPKQYQYVRQLLELLFPKYKKSVVNSVSLSAHDIDLTK